MPRKTREDWCGTWHHVMNRGRNRSYRNPLLAIIFTLAVAHGCSTCDPQASGGEDNLAVAFASSNATVADSAYMAFFEGGRRSIPALLKLSQVEGNYAGRAYYVPTSSVGFVRDFPIASVALYLIDCIIHSTSTPHYAPILAAHPSIPLAQRQSIARDRYAKWWASVHITDVQFDPDAVTALLLTEPAVWWVGAVEDQADPKQPDPNKQESSGLGRKVPGSNTPRKKPPPPIPLDGGNPGGLVTLEPKKKGGPRPYNCLTWALGCGRITDRWIEPSHVGKFDDKNWLRLLNHYGYDNKAVGCEGPCPKGRGPKIMFIFQVPRLHDKKSGKDFYDPGLIGDETFTHAMKRHPNGKWSSKNGDDFRYEDITDIDGFLGKHYKPGKRFMNVKKCFCKRPPPPDEDNKQ